VRQRQEFHVPRGGRHGDGHVRSHVTSKAASRRNEQDVRSRAPPDPPIGDDCRPVAPDTTLYRGCSRQWTDWRDHQSVRARFQQRALIRSWR